MRTSRPSVRCAPPDNTATADRDRELHAAPRRRTGCPAPGAGHRRPGTNRVGCVLADGRATGRTAAARPAFAHGQVVDPGVAGMPAIVESYHPSRQNTNTRRLTPPMMPEVFTTARRLIDAARSRDAVTDAAGAAASLDAPSAAQRDGAAGAAGTCARRHRGRDDRVGHRVPDRRHRAQVARRSPSHPRRSSSSTPPRASAA